MRVGESSPGVPITLLQDWTDQFIRDELMLKIDINVE